MHIGGLREYAARGIPIYALDVNVPVVRSLLSAPHAQVPDSLAKVRVLPVVRSIGSRTRKPSPDWLSTSGSLSESPSGVGPFACRSRIPPV